MRKALLLLVIPLALGVDSCSKSEEKKPNTVTPPPGPIIVIGGGTGGTVTFEIEMPSGAMAAQGDGGPANGLLREDFIGQKLVKLECILANGQPVTANKITATEGVDPVVRRLTLERTPEKTLKWTLEDLSTTPPTAVVLGPTAPTNGKVPREFLQLLDSTLKEANLNVACSKVTFQLDVKAP
jgi:hypothetical protein